MLMVLDTALSLQISHLQLSTHSAPNVFNPVSIYHVWRSGDFPPHPKKTTHFQFNMAYCLVTTNPKKND